MRNLVNFIALAVVMVVVVPAWAAGPVAQPVAAEAPSQIVTADVPAEAEAEVDPATNDFLSDLSQQGESVTNDCNDVIGHACSPNGAVTTCSYPPYYFPLSCWCYQGTWRCGI